MKLIILFLGQVPVSFVQIAHMLTETYAEAAFPLAAVPGLDPANDFQHLCAALLTATVSHL